MPTRDTPFDPVDYADADRQVGLLTDALTSQDPAFVVAALLTVLEARGLDAAAIGIEPRLSRVLETLDTPASTSWRERGSLGARTPPPDRLMTRRAPRTIPDPIAESGSRNGAILRFPLWGPRGGRRRRHAMGEKEEAAFARPDMAEKSLWIETPQTEAAMMALFRVLDVTRLDDPGWQPTWVLCGEPGVGKTALARRFAAQAQRSAACDAVHAAEEALAQEMAKPRAIPSPDQFKLRDSAWERYRTFTAMSPEETVRRFGSCPHV